MKNKIKINSRIVAVLLGIIISLCTILVCNKPVEAEMVRKKETSSKTYFNSSDNNFYIIINGPNSSDTSKLKIHAKYEHKKGVKFHKATTANEFRDSKQEVKLTGTQVTKGSFNISFKDGNYKTKVDDGGKSYTDIKFSVSFTKPAHMNGNGTSWDVPQGTHHSSNWGNCNDHATTSETKTLNFEVSIYNFGIITFDGNSGNNEHIRFYGGNATFNFKKPAYTYTLNDSLNGNKSESCTCGTEKYLPNNSCSGYDFLGWKGTNGVTYSTGTKTVLCADRTFTAQWKAQSHYVTFDTQGGTFPSSLKSQTELDGCKIIPNGIYSIKSNCGSNMYIHVYGAGYNKTQDNATAICIYGGKSGSQTQWVIERYKNTQYYTITSYHNGLALSLAGSPTNNQPGTGQKGRQLELWSMEKDIIDYQWYFKENNGHLEIYNRSTNQCLDVYDAGTTNGTKIWQYNPNHSYAQWWDFEPVVQADYPFKLQYANYNLLTPSISPQRGSDKFLGWSTDKNATSPTYYANSVCNIYGNSNVTLYAIYQARATVSYDANGGSNASLPKPKVVDVGSKITLASAGTMGRDNYVFLGWSTDPHAAKNYDPADSEVTVNSSGNVVYYAIWKNATGNADLSNVITGDGMFTNDTELEGQNGTTYNSIHDGLDYAKPDGGVDEPGYYIEK